MIDAVDSVISTISERMHDVNVVSFSGGKDSSVVLCLVLAALRKDPSKKLYTFKYFAHIIK